MKTVDKKQPADRDPDAEQTAPAPSRTSRTAGSVKQGKYEILSLLGTGGMGKVFKARDRHLDRVVALKFLTGDSSERLDRFLVEARAQARVKHDNICDIYEIGRIEDKPFIAVRYIDGARLDEICETLSLEQKLGLVRDVAEALHAAHRSGLIHRDVKPGNVMVERLENGALKPYILDFGLAREVESQGITVTGLAVGTPAYMAPEQVLGESHRLDRRTDVYALGSTLYKVLTRKLPFGEGSSVEVLSRVLKDDPEPPRRVDPSIPPDVETIVMTCLRKEPERRYDSARALAEDLQRYLDGEPIVARRTRWPARLVRRAKRHKAVFAVALAAALSLGLLGTLYVRSLFRAAEQTRSAQRFGQEVKEIETILRLARMSPLHHLGPEREQVRRRIEGLQETIDAAGSLAAGPGHYAVGRGYLALDENDAAKSHLEKAMALGYREPEVSYALGYALGELYKQALEKARRIESPEERERLQAEFAAQYREPALGHLRDAEGVQVESPDYAASLLAYYGEQWDEALALAERASNEVGWLYEAVRLQGDVYFAKGEEKRWRSENEAAVALFTQGQGKYEAAVQIAPSDARTYESLIDLLAATAYAKIQDRRDPTQQVALARSALDKALTVDPASARAYAGMAYCLFSLGLHQWDSEKIDPSPTFQEMVRLSKKAVELRPDWAIPYQYLGIGYGYLSRWGMDHGKDTTELADLAFTNVRLATEKDPAYAYGFYALGHGYHDLARLAVMKGADPVPHYEKAIEAEKRALEISPDWSWPKHLWMICLLKKFRYLVEKGADSEPLLDEVRQAAQSLFQDPSLSVARFRSLGQAHYLVARSQVKAGTDPRDQLGKARYAYERVLDVSPGHAEALERVARCWLMEAQHDAADKTGSGQALRNARRSLDAALKAAGKPTPALKELEQQVLRSEGK